jgi:hypothetical protein
MSPEFLRPGTRRVFHFGGAMWVGEIKPGRSDIQSAELEGVVIRCGCSPADRERALWHGRFNQPCPTPKLHEHLGVIATYHRNPIVHFWRQLRLRLRR